MDCFGQRGNEFTHKATDELWIMQGRPEAHTRLFVLYNPDKGVAFAAGVICRHFLIARIS